MISLLDFVVGDVKPPCRSQTQGRQVQEDQQIQGPKSRGTEGQTEMGADARISFSRTSCLELVRFD